MPKLIKTKKLGEIADIKSGSTPSRSQHDRYFKDGTIPWVKTMDLNNGFIYKTDELITKVAIEETSCSVLPAGTVLVAMYGGFNQIGRTGLLKVDAAVNQAISAIRLDEKLALPEYILQYLNGKIDYWKKFAASSRKDPNITRNDVCDFPVILPSLEEQKKTAEILATWDEAIALTERAIEAKQSLRTALLGKLLSFEESFQTKIGDISQVKSGSTPLRGNYELYFKDGTIPWIKTMDLNNGFIDKTDELITDAAIRETACSVFPRDTVLVAMYGGFNQIGRTGLLKIDAAVNQAISAIQVDKSVVLPKYLLQYLNAKVDYWKRFAASSRKDPNITRRDVCDFPIEVPSLLEQKKIVDVLETSDDEIGILHQYYACLQRQKRGLMQKLLTGEWRVAVQEAA